MHEIKVRRITQARPIFEIWFRWPRGIPTHVRNLHTRHIAKAFDLSTKQPKPRNAGTLIARIKKNLIPKANAQIWTPGGYPAANQIRKTALLQLRHAIAKRTNARQQQVRRIAKLSGIGHHRRLLPQGTQGIGHTAQVSRAIINKRNLHSAALVLGIPLTRGSISQASRNARARPLKIASAMW